MNDGVSEKQPPLTQPGDAGPRKRYRSDDLFGGEREIVITHAGNGYVLRITRHNKLILTK